MFPLGSMTCFWPFLTLGDRPSWPTRPWCVEVAKAAEAAEKAISGNFWNFFGLLGKIGFFGIFWLFAFIFFAFFCFFGKISIFSRSRNIGGTKMGTT
jgi:hypothetical protein